MHVNLDLLECCHLTSAMLLEVPAMVVEEARNKQLRGAPPRTRVTSRHFRKHMDIFSRQVFTGPPENTRDHILCAAKALALGDWRECARLVVELDVWDLIPGTGEAEKVKAMVREKIKAEALRTYLFARADAYDALSLEGQGHGAREDQGRSFTHLFVRARGRVRRVVPRKAVRHVRDARENRSWSCIKNDDHEGAAGRLGPADQDDRTQTPGAVARASVGVGLCGPMCRSSGCQRTPIRCQSRRQG